MDDEITFFDLQIVDQVEDDSEIVTEDESVKVENEKDSNLQIVGQVKDDEKKSINLESEKSDPNEEIVENANNVKAENIQLEEGELEDEDENQAENDNDVDKEKSEVEKKKEPNKEDGITETVEIAKINKGEKTETDDTIVLEKEPVGDPQSEEAEVEEIKDDSEKDDASVICLDEEGSKSCHDEETNDISVSISEITQEYEEDESTANIHPYTFMIENFELTKEQTMHTKISPPKSLEETPVNLIQSRTDLMKLLPILNNSKEIALDMKIDKSGFYSVISVLAISSRDADYVIDVKKVNQDILLLTEIFINPKLVKIMFKSESILPLLQQIYHLFVINIFDVDKAFKALKKQTGLSIYEILNKEFAFETKNHGQFSIHRRPFDKQALSYCRASTHYLIHLYHNSKNELLSKNGKLFQEFMDQCREISKIIYPSISLYCLGQLQEEMKNRHQCELEILEKLNYWRNNVAKKVKRPPSSILNKQCLMSLVTEMPSEPAVIIAISKSEFVQNDIETMTEIITSAKRKYNISPQIYPNRLYPNRKKDGYKDFVIKTLLTYIKEPGLKIGMKRKIIEKITTLFPEQAVKLQDLISPRNINKTSPIQRNKNQQANNNALNKQNNPKTVYRGATSSHSNSQHQSTRNTGSNNKNTSDTSRRSSISTSCNDRDVDRKRKISETDSKSYKRRH